MVSDGGAKRYWLLYTALGLIFLAGSSALFSWTWVYVSPRDPDVVSQKTPKGPEANYQPGGAGCEPAKLAALRTKGAQRERDRCAQAREEHRVEQENLNQQVRSVDLAERNLRLSERQARAAVVTTLATVAAFLAAALAAFAAFFAVYYAKRSADADNASLEETRNGLAEARADAIEQTQRFQAQIATASKAAEAASRQADIAEDTARKHLRAYVYAEALSYIWSSEGEPLFTLTIRNAGLTPAVSIFAGAVSMLGKLTETPQFDGLTPLSPERVIGGGIAHETTLWVKGSDALKRGEMSWNNTHYVFGRIRYQDVFGSVYESKFGFFTTINEAKTGMTPLGSMPPPFTPVTANA